VTYASYGTFEAVGTVLQGAGLKVSQFIRYKVGEK